MELFEPLKNNSQEHRNSVGTEQRWIHGFRKDRQISGPCPQMRNMWNMSVTVIPVIVGALRIITYILEKRIAKWKFKEERRLLFLLGESSSVAWRRKRTPGIKLIVFISIRYGCTRQVFEFGIYLFIYSSPYKGKMWHKFG